LLVARRLAQLPAFQASRHIAFYLCNDGELDLGPAMQVARRCGKRSYVPALYPGRARWLRFAELRDDTRLVADKYGILEPAGGFRNTVPAHALDLVLVPLVAFDLDGRRVGMGGGYYDRTFEYLRWRRCWHRPRLVGVAYEIQRVAHIDEDTWDVPLHAIVTENGYYPAAEKAA
jgi:5-formyltetrahydrofolate cyclo-ligase